MNTGSELLLYGVFRALVEHRMPLGVPDYVDALKILSIQSERNDPLHTDRAGLKRLCQILWARSPEESRLIDRVFEDIAPPERDEIEEVQRGLEHAVTMLEPSKVQEPMIDESKQTHTAGVREEATAAESLAAAISVESASDKTGVPLPYPVVPTLAGEVFVMQPQTVIAARALAVLWRRYRRMLRTGPRTELDLEATISERALRGILGAPVFRSRKVNRAKLLILADVSPSMAPWRPFLEGLAQSLRLSRLQSSTLLYFSNVPRRSLFEEAMLFEPTSTAEALDRNAGAALLVISDGGAARGYSNRQRAQQTVAFLDGVKKRMRVVVWINPMPRVRWTSTTADTIAARSGVTSLPLDLTSMIRAVDILRGAKAR